MTTLALPQQASGSAACAGFWSSRWGYPQALTVATMLIGIALAVQVRFPDVAVSLPRGWAGWAVVFGPPVLLGALRCWRDRDPVLSGLGGVPMAVVSVLAMALLAVPGAIWPQGEEAPGWAHRFGFDHVFSSFPMAAASALVLANLAACTMRRMASLHAADVRFVLIHAGLLLAIGSAFVGSSQLLRVRLPLVEGAGPSRIGLLGDERYELPFAVSLADFRMESFPPAFAIAKPLDGTQGQWRISSGTEFLAPGVRERAGQYEVEVLEVIAAAGVVGGVPRAFPQEGAGPAVRVRVRRGDAVLAESAWLHAATPFGEELFLQLDAETVLLLQAPRPKSFASRIVLHGDGEERAAVLSVNGPVRHAGWTLYQLGYDESQGAASSLSVIEAVRDPAYPAVALGCWLAVIGCLWFFWDAAKLAAAKRDAGEAMA